MLLMFYFELVYYRRPTMLQEGKVYTCLSVSQLVYSWREVPLPMVHLTSPYKTPSGHGTSGPPSPLFVTSGGHHWRPVKTCSLQDPLPLTSADIYW